MGGIQRRTVRIGERRRTAVSLQILDRAMAGTKDPFIATVTRLAREHLELPGDYPARTDEMSDIIVPIAELDASYNDTSALMKACTHAFLPSYISLEQVSIV